MQASQALKNSEPLIKDWLIKWNCSVFATAIRGFLCVARAGFDCDLAIFENGAWLVLPFTGIELTVVGVAFVIYARHAVDFERIRLYQNRLLIEQMSAEELTQFEFNPY